MLEVEWWRIINGSQLKLLKILKEEIVHRVGGGLKGVTTQSLPGNFSCTQVTPPTNSVSSHCSERVCFGKLKNTSFIQPCTKLRVFDKRKAVIIPCFREKCEKIAKNMMFSQGFHQLQNSIFTECKLSKNQSYHRGLSNLSSPLALIP